MGIESEAGNSPIWGEMYSLYRALFDDPQIQVKRFYFQRIDGDNFVRPSFLIKFVGLEPRSRNTQSKFVQQEVMIKYHAQSEWGALAVADAVIDLLSGWPEKMLPQWNFEDSPPTKFSINGLDEFGRAVEMRDPIRIDPGTIRSSGPVEMPDFTWEVPITFTMSSSRRAAYSAYTLTGIDYAFLLTQLPEVTHINTYTEPTTVVEIV